MQKSATANIDSLKADLKSKKAEIKKLDKELASLAEKKDEADNKAATEANKKKAEELVANALGYEILLKLRVEIFEKIKFGGLYVYFQAQENSSEYQERH